MIPRRLAEAVEGKLFAHTLYYTCVAKTSPTPTPPTPRPTFGFNNDLPTFGFNDDFDFDDFRSGIGRA
jgi:hypothetical protein